MQELADESSELVLVAVRKAVFDADGLSRLVTVHPETVLESPEPVVLLSRAAQRQPADPWDLGQWIGGGGRRSAGHQPAEPEGRHAQAKYSAYELAAAPALHQ